MSNTTTTNRLNSSFFYFNNVSELEAIELNKKAAKKADFNYYAFKTPIGVHSRALPKDFISQISKYFKDEEYMHKSISDAFRRYFGAGIDGVIYNNATKDMIYGIKENLDGASRWSLVEKDGSWHIVALDFPILFDN